MPLNPLARRRDAPVEWKTPGKLARIAEQNKKIRVTRGGEVLAQGVLVEHRAEENGEQWLRVLGSQGTAIVGMPCPERWKKRADQYAVHLT